LVDRADRLPELPFLDQPGRCPCCGADLRPEPDQVVLGGSWLKPDGKGSFKTIGYLVSYQCPQCSTPLLSGTHGWPMWDDIDPSQLCWSPAPAGPV
jgi:hypothetical protein